MCTRRRGRPRKSESEKTKVITTIRLTDNEKDALMEIASRNNLSLYHYIHKVIKDDMQNTKSGKYTQ